MRISGSDFRALRPRGPRCHDPLSTLLGNRRRSVSIRLDVCDEHVYRQFDRMFRTLVLLARVWETGPEVRS